MKLERLELQNIRSYGHAAIEFQNGVTLLEGDVGSGKSTVLYAIEFALFGFGDIKAAHVLRHGADTGFVTLALDVNGKKIRIHRALERKKTVKQLPGWIEEDGLRTEYSPEEIKTRVLNLLGFKENPSPKATSWIFRYAVFTPQEQMKEILSLKPEDRLQTLRKAFGVEQYKTAQENAILVQRAYREKIREIDGMLLDLPEWLERRENLEKQKAEIQAQTQERQRDLKEARARLDDAQKKLDELEKKAVALEKVGAELPLIQRQAADVENQLQELKRQETRRQEQLKELEAKTLQLKERMRPVPETALDEFQAAEKTFYRLQAELGAAEQKATQFKQLQHGKCPTCGQKIQGSLAERMNHAQQELSDKKSEYDAAKTAFEDARKKRDAFQEQKTLQERLADVNAQRERLLQPEAAETLQRLEKQKSALLAQQDEKAQEFAAFKHVQAQRQDAKKERDALREEKSRVEQALARLDAEKKNADGQLQQTQKKIHEKKEREKERYATTQKTAWLEEHFQPALSQIEQHVLRKINDEFNHYFKTHLATLLENPDVDAEVDDAFTPKIEQQGYEQDWTALSGGEKSALALSYRLALNQLVRQTTPSLQNNLLMLDEPTDGFSKEQLARMRDTLNALNANQVILVSHERELEAFCDQVFLVQKHDGQSTIRAL